MRRTLYLTSFVLAAGLAALFLFKPASSPAKGAKGDEPDAAPAARAPFAPLPIARAVLFSSGVGYFQREGEVEGSTRIDFSFPVQDINDLLKSLVLQDLGGGHITAVSYDSHDPVEKTLQSFAVNLNNNPGFGQLLTQARGERVEVILQQPNALQPGPLSGAIIGVERQRQAVGKDAVVKREVLNLWCADGLRAVKLADIDRVRFLNPVLEGEVKKALAVLATSHDAQKKAVSLSFTGEGRRKVKVGYVVQNPMWKTSYRLVLNQKGKPFLQGWAVVENPSDEDWNNVRMSLVSGRPISFQMDLYRPLYVPRPVVEPELFASLRPPAYSGGMGMGGGGAGMMGGMGASPSTPMADSAVPMAPRPVEKTAGASRAPTEAKQELDAIQLGVDHGVASAATAVQLGDYFEYAIDHAVSLPRQKSALLPIVNQDVEAARVSIYNEGTHAKFPLLGLRFKNTTGLHLMQGPVTVFDGASYAGDARILDLQPNEERLLGFAIDLGTEVEPVAKRSPDRVVALKVTKGILTETRKLRETQTYAAKNRSDQDRRLIIEHPFRPGYKLISKDQPAERARDVYRFEVKVPAGKTASLEVAEEQDLTRQIALTNSDDNTLRLFLNSQTAGEEVKAALRRALELKGKWDATRREIEQQQGRLKVISEDQARLRENLKNLKQLPEAEKLTRRYLQKLEQQETEIEDLEGKIKKLRETEEQGRKDYESFLANLTVE